MRKHTTLVLALLLFVFLLIPSIVLAATWFSCIGDTFCGASTQPYGNCSIDIAYQSDSPTGNPNIWRWTYAKGTPGGEGIAAVWLPQPPGGAQEMWAQWYWKYSPGFSYHGVMNKQLYFQPSNTMGMGISGGGVEGNAHVMMTTQGQNMKAHEPLVNMNSWYANTGVWHKYKARYVLNTGNKYNGIYQAWIDDVMVADYSNVYYQDGTSQFSSPVMMVIYGGIGGSVPQTQYLYMAGLYFGSTDPGGGSYRSIDPGGGSYQKIPLAPTIIEIK